MVSGYLTYGYVITLVREIDGFVESMDNKIKDAQAKNDQAVLDQINNEIDRGLDEILSGTLVDYYDRIWRNYHAGLEKINHKSIVNDMVLSVCSVLYPVKAESKILASRIYDRCNRLLNNNIIMFPAINAADSYVPYYVTYDNREEMTGFIDSLLYSFVSQVMVGKLSLTIVDSENHGRSSGRFSDVMDKLLDLSGGQFLTESESITRELRRLDDKLDDILRNTLGTEYDTVFDYVEQDLDYDLDVEVVVLYDFPYGIPDGDMPTVKRLIENGSRCGIYVVIAGSQTDPGNISDEKKKSIQAIRQMCIDIRLDEKGPTFCGLPFSYSDMPDREHLDAFVLKYRMIYESRADGADSLNPFIRPLLGCADDELENRIGDIRTMAEEYGMNLGKVPEDGKEFPQHVMIGSVDYPADIFEDAHGYEMIKKHFSSGEGVVRLPLVMDTKETICFWIEGGEEDIPAGQRFAHNFMWSFLSAVPVTKLNISVFDCERKGNSITPFLELKKKSPELFDRDIHTDAEKVYDRLKTFNAQMDDCIQNKLGNKYKSIIEYNMDNPARNEAIQLLVINDFPSGFDSRSVDLLASILKNGSRCGIYTLINYNRDMDARFSRYDNADEYIGQVKKYATVINIKDDACYLSPYDLKIGAPAEVSSGDAERFAEDYAARANTVKNKGLSFQGILDTELFARNAGESLEIPVGIGDGSESVAISFGKGSSHHALVAGATGSGKSTLLHTLIMSAMLHYSPDELNLYLMDFKSGTEFKVYDSHRLPHIKCLALDAMQEFGESILEDLVNEMVRRSEKFKEKGASKLGEYIRNTGTAMPRILVIMDEFQILFNDTSNRKVAHNCAELAKRIVTEGRAFGIHLLMATQSTKVIPDLSLASGTVDQMRIRIGLKCGEDDARYLFKDNNDLKALDMMKGPIGTAVMNPEYTEGENVGFRVVFCDGDTQGKMLGEIEQKFAHSECTTQVFEGNRTRELLDIFKETDALAAEKKNVEAEVGELIKIAPPLNLVFDRKQKHNIVICGSDGKMGSGIFNSLCLNILLKSKTSRMYCIDGEIIVDEDESMPYYEQFQRFGDRFSLAATRGNIIESVNEIYDIYKQKKKGKEDAPVFVGIKNFQFLDIVKQMIRGDYIDESEYLDSDFSGDAGDEPPADGNGFFDFGLNADAPDSQGVSDKLRKLIDEGSAYGIYFIISCTGFQDIKDYMYYGENILSKFPERFVFALNDNDANSLIEGIAVTSLNNNTVYYSDSVKSTYQVKPYIFPGADELKGYLDSLDI